MNKIKFTSPVNKGETFTIDELFDVSENQKEFQKYINDEKEKQIDSLKEQLDNKYKAAANKKIEEMVIIKSKEIELNYKEKNIEEFAKLKALTEAKDETIKSITKQLEENKEIIKTARQEIEKSLNESYERRNQDLEDKFKEKEKNLAMASKQANVIGENAEEEIRGVISSLFPNDKIIKPNASMGEADIFHEIMNQNKSLGSIYYEIKNKNSWAVKDLENFAAKVRARKDDFNIFIGKVIMKDVSKSPHIKKITNELYFDERNNIYVSTFDSYPHVVYTLRQLLFKYISEINVQENISDIKDKLFEFIRSQEFSNYFQRMLNSVSQANAHFENIQRESTKGKFQLDLIKTDVENLVEKSKSFI